MFGNILRLGKEKPASKAMKFMFEEERSSKAFRGRKRAIIYPTINRDVKKTKESNPSFSNGEMKSEIDLHNIGIQSKE